MSSEESPPFLIATRNRHKAEEIIAFLGSLPRFLLVTLRELPGLGELPEDGDTFAANATQKADGVLRFLRDTGHRWSGSAGYVLADDSGLEVDALGGQPGVHSARFAFLESGQPGNAPDSENNAKLLRLLRDVPAPNQSARFRCVLALVRLSDPIEPRLFDGACEGRIIEAPTGDGGFGYDPLFVPDGHPETFAELSPARKNEISHRARALAKLRDFLQSNPG